MARQQVSNEEKVKRYYPTATCLKDENGLYYIGIPIPKINEDHFKYEIVDDEFELDDDDLDELLSNQQYHDLLDEYLFNHTKTPEEAWSLALTSSKTTQNFNRTHPDRMVLEHEDNIEERMLRSLKKVDKIQSSRQQSTI